MKEVDRRTETEDGNKMGQWAGVGRQRDREILYFECEVLKEEISVAI